MSLVMVEVMQRGFLSNYITILTTFREFVGRRQYSGEDIYISPQMFSLYGHPKNWFEEKRISHSKEFETIQSTHYIDIDPWPTSEQLNLNEYRKYFSYNQSFNSYLKNNLKELSNCIGVHYRGTDHNQHVDRVDLNKFFDQVSVHLEKDSYDGIFVATDEDNVIEKFEQVFSGVKIFHNNTIKSSTNTPLHFSNFDDDVKIQLGNQVLLDSHSISNCKIAFGKTSNIINYARILNSNLNVYYMDKDLQFRG
jgi:hypothetical protein